ncbi:gtpase crac1b [Anaeramoeba ignava]|uniref:Gtpase crac1b n=1 Tax=Anaeramoeba ignava TaxID=1746090 RepID=A0A9Q0LDM0_ANAIG|nr:gtpase crac1b [Anaeramoeba ignava]
MSKSEYKIGFVGDIQSDKHFLLATYSKKKIQIKHNIKITKVQDFVKKLPIKSKKKEKITFIDISEEANTNLSKEFTRANVLVVCFSFRNPESLENIESKWLQEISKNAGHCPLAILGIGTEFRRNQQIIKSIQDRGKQPPSAKDGLEMTLKVGAHMYFEMPLDDLKMINSTMASIVSTMFDPELKDFQKKIKRQNKPQKVVNKNEKETNVLETKQYSYKFVVVGDQFSNKDSLLYLYDKEKMQDYKQKSSISSFLKNFEIDGKSVKVSVYDGSFQEDNSRNLTYLNSNLVLICFSLQIDESFENAKNLWFPEISKNCPNVPIVLVATYSNQIDSQNHIPKVKILQFAKEINAINYFIVEIAPKYQSIDSLKNITSLLFHNPSKLKARIVVEHQIESMCLLNQSPEESREALGLSYLHLAVLNGDFQHIQTFIDAGADLSEKTGMTVLHYACICDTSLSLIRSLLDYGVDVNAKTNETPLHFACQSNSNPALLTLLIKRGADVNAKNNWNALHYICEFEGDPECAEILLEARCDPNLKNNKTPIQIAEELEILEILQIMQKK